MPQLGRITLPLTLRAFFSSRTEIGDALTPLDLEAHAFDAALRNACTLSKRWLAMPPVEMKSLVLDSFTSAASAVLLRKNLRARRLVTKGCASQKMRLANCGFWRLMRLKLNVGLPLSEPGPRSQLPKGRGLDCPSGQSERIALVSAKDKGIYQKPHRRSFRRARRCLPRKSPPRGQNKTTPAPLSRNRPRARESM